jgi:LysM repeat protein
MKKLALSFFGFLFAACIAIGQKGDLVVKTGDNGLYLEHKVVAKESFYALSRLYNVSPKFIASFNKLDLNKGLFIDQKIRIPLTDTNFIQRGNTGSPVYYKVGDKEGLMTVSNKNNNVLLTDLRSWNNLATDEVEKGSKLIIGFLVSKGMPAITIAAKPTPREPITKTEEKPADEPVLNKEEKKDEKKEAEKELKAEKKEEKKEEKNKPEPVQITQVENQVSAGEGYFKKPFEQQIKTIPLSKNETVTAGIFKTTSGWQDAKYYLLMDKVAPGTIVKVINPVNNKAVYAKVLGEMSGIRQNAGLDIRISNAAATTLGINEPDKFIVKVNY